jgi:hypothetical protein
VCTVRIRALPLPPPVCFVARVQAAAYLRDCCPLCVCEFFWTATYPIPAPLMNYLQRTISHSAFPGGRSALCYVLQCTGLIGLFFFIFPSSDPVDRIVWPPTSLSLRHTSRSRTLRKKSAVCFNELPGMATGYGLETEGRGSSPGRVKNFLRSVQTGSGAHPTSCNG